MARYGQCAFRFGLYRYAEDLPYTASEILDRPPWTRDPDGTGFVLPVYESDGSVRMVTFTNLTSYEYPQQS